MYATPLPPHHRQPQTGQQLRPLGRCLLLCPGKDDSSSPLALVPQELSLRMEFHVEALLDRICQQFVDCGLERQTGVDVSLSVQGVCIYVYIDIFFETISTLGFLWCIQVPPTYRYAK